MKRAERIIRQRIEELTVDRIAPKKNEIEQAIKFMYWQGAFSKRKYNKMNELLNNKYTEIMDKYDKEIAEACDRDFERLKRRFGMK